MGKGTAGTIQHYKNIINGKNVIGCHNGSNAIGQKNSGQKSIDKKEVKEKFDFEDDLMLSEVVEDNDSSIISHIEPAELFSSKKYDKWDILYNYDEWVKSYCNW